MAFSGPMVRDKTPPRQGPMFPEPGVPIRLIFLKPFLGVNGRGPVFRLPVRVGIGRLTDIDGKPHNRNVIGVIDEPQDRIISVIHVKLTLDIGVDGEVRGEAVGVYTGGEEEGEEEQQE